MTMTERAACVVVILGLLAGFVFFLRAWMEERWRHFDTQALLRRANENVGILRRQLSHANAELTAAGGNSENEQ